MHTGVFEKVFTLGISNNMDTRDYMMTLIQCLAMIMLSAF